MYLHGCKPDVFFLKGWVKYRKTIIETIILSLFCEIVKIHLQCGFKVLHFSSCFVFKVYVIKMTAWISWNYLVRLSFVRGN